MFFRNLFRALLALLFLMPALAMDAVLFLPKLIFNIPKPFFFSKKRYVQMNLAFNAALAPEYS